MKEKQLQRFSPKRKSPIRNDQIWEPVELSSSSVGWRATSPPRPVSPPPLVHHLPLQERSHWPTNFSVSVHFYPPPSEPENTHIAVEERLPLSRCPLFLPPSSLLQEQQEKSTGRSCPPVHTALQSLVHRERTLGGFSLSFSPSLCRFLPDAAAP